jgi:hypothetical protein
MHFFMRAVIFIFWSNELAAFRVSFGAEVGRDFV